MTLGLLSALGGAALLKGCAPNSVDASNANADIDLVQQALSGTSALAWVDTILGAWIDATTGLPLAVAPAPRAIGDLATKTSTQLGATLVVAKGCVTPGDGGGGLFYWSTSGTDDGGTVIVPNANVGSAGTAGCWVRIYSGALDVKWFGAYGDDTPGLDDTAACQAALNRAALLGAEVLVPAGRYPVRALRIKNGTRALLGSGTLVGIGNYGEGVLELDGVHFSTAAVSGCTVRGIAIDCARGSRRAIFAATAAACTFCDLYIYGLTVNGTSDSGICLHFGSHQNQVLQNTIDLLPNPTNNLIGIYVTGYLTDSYAGYFANAGVISGLAHTTYENNIDGNSIHGGSHGISLSNSVRNTVTGNRLTGQRDRGVILAPAANHNIVSENICQDFGSSGIHLLLSSYNKVFGNTCVSYVSNGEAGLQAYVGSHYNLFADNHVECTSRYGMYLGAGASSNRVAGNQLLAYQRAGIALESDFAALASSPYSRPNYGPPPVGSTWTFADSTHNVIESNVIGDPSQPTAAGLLLAQVGATYALAETVVQDNRITSSVVQHAIYLSEVSAGKLYACSVSGNTTAGAVPTKVGLSRGRAHFKRATDNETLNGGPFSFAAGDTTPSIGIGDAFQCANVALTMITYFDDGVDGQEILVRLDVNTQLVHDLSKLRLKGATNVVGANSDCFARFRRVSNIWFEQSRNW